MSTEISPELLAAYQATEYWVSATPNPFCLQVGRHSAPLELILDDSGCCGAAFISAHNPFSESHTANANTFAHEKLRQVLEGQAKLLIEGVGRNSAGHWPEEESFLAVGISLTKSRQVGTAFLQNAIVWAERDAVPRLILLR